MPTIRTALNPATQRPTRCLQRVRAVQAALACGARQCETMNGFDHD